MTRVKQRWIDASAIALKPRFWEKLKPNQNPNPPAVPKLPECDRCLLYPHNPHLVCAVHPTDPSTDTCIDFREDPNAASEDLWEPEGASYYNGELILQRPAAVDTPCNS